MLCDFLRMENNLQFFRTSRHALRLIHCFSLALSGVVRNALSEEELAIEAKARGRVTVDVTSDWLNAFALFTTHKAVRSPLTAEERSKLFTIIHSTYVWYELDQKVGAVRVETGL